MADTVVTTVKSNSNDVLLNIIHNCKNLLECHKVSCGLVMMKVQRLLVKEVTALVRLYNTLMAK